MLICPHLVDPKDGGAIVSKDVLDANNVQMLQSLTTENEVNERLQKNLPSPTPPRALPLPEDPPKPQKRTLMDIIRGRK